MRHSSNKAWQDWTLIFLHIPKTAGLTLLNIIQRQYDTSSIHFHVGDPKYVHRFKEIPESQRSDIKVLPGHLPFGMHKYLPQPSVYVTLLRDPIERVISQYYSVRSRREHAMYSEANRKNLKELLLSGLYQRLDNFQTRMLAGMPGMECEYGACTPEILDAAKKNLSSSFSVVGLTERFDETLVLLKRVFGWKNLLYVKKNVTEKRLNKEDISNDTLQAILKYNELDIELYRYAEELFERAVNQYGVSFERDLKNFRLLEKYYLDALQTNDVEFKSLEDKYTVDVAAAIYTFNKFQNDDNVEVFKSIAEEIISQYPISHQIKIHNSKIESSPDKKLFQADEFIRQNKMAEARFLLNQMIRSKDYKVRAFNRLAAIELAEGNDEKAIEYIDKVLKLDNKNEDALKNFKLAEERAENLQFLIKKIIDSVDKKEMFAEQLCGQDPSFEKELESLKLQNNQSEESHQEETVIFVHIPKTAGTTMWNILREQYDPKTIYKCDDFIILRDFQYYVAFVHKLWAISIEQRKQLNVIGGHIPFGFHKFLCRPSAYFTILRDPIERVVSDYYHLLRSSEHIFYREVTSKNMSLSDYVRSGINQTLDNGQCRLLSGVLNAGYGQCTTEILDVAKANLREQFRVVGLAERFDETLILLKRAFGWRAPYYNAVNVAENKPRTYEIPADTLKVLEEYNELDLELYRYGQELFERLLDQQDSSFEKEVVSFKAANCRRENLVSAEMQALTG